MTRQFLVLSALWVALLSAIICCLSLQTRASSTMRRRLLETPDPKSVETKPVPAQKMYPTDDHPNGPEMSFALPPYAAEWCLKPKLQPLPYIFCNHTDVINQLPLFGGLTNALKMVLLGTILSFEENRCFYIDESKSHLHNRRNLSDVPDSFIDKYFEPIGLPANDELVLAAKKEKRIQVRGWEELWKETHNRRARHQTFDIPSLYYYQMPGHRLKGVMLRRMFRWLPQVQTNTCNALAKYGLLDEFMAFSVRRGDKTLEKFEFATLEQYIQAAQSALPQWFNGTVPKIFVATDDCTVMKEFREMRPSWTFLSECDTAVLKADHGFALDDVKDWDSDETDRHYNKFFVELLGMATAKYFIGVWYTNVSWWAFFMRRNDLGSFQLLDTKGKPEFLIKWW
jgi:hypothetical protein